MQGIPSSRFSTFLRERSFTTAKLAKLSGYSAEAVRSWRCGSRKPSHGAKVVVAQVLGITLRKLESLLAS